ncbi:uncharacterized protein FTOL_10598 [Fusarium torulosum]|uniref:Uncharacterized protein n=1 Tax=Fusarium torulosum TaxID=33205 RepID=A0AAE8SM67_9HYPO|nr:uncharacterized protein FTOL_10598 [Fusarium torulosum]
MDCHRTVRPRSQAPPFKNSHERLEGVCDRLTSYAEDITKDCVETVSKVLEVCKSLLPGAEGKAEKQQKKSVDDFIEGGRSYKANMKK